VTIKQDKITHNQTGNEQ